MEKGAYAVSLEVERDRCDRGLVMSNNKGGKI